MFTFALAGAGPGLGLGQAAARRFGAAEEIAHAVL